MDLCMITASAPDINIDILFISNSWFCILFQHIVHSMRDPSIAAFWLITLPQIVGGFDYDDDVKQKIWWQYKVLHASCFIFPTVTES